MVDMNTPSETQPIGRAAEYEWIIQRCTQQWIGTELQYQDWGPYGPGTMSPLTEAAMLDALDAFSKKWPEDEFRGHNILNCKCEAHAALKVVA